MKKSSSSALLALTMAAALGGGIDFGFPKEKKPKNKYNLTPEEIEQMSEMTPKEKRTFLKGRK